MFHRIRFDVCIILYRSEETGSLRNYSSVRTTIANFVHEGLIPSPGSLQCRW
jgi:hypothetical protein